MPRARDAFDLLAVLVEAGQEEDVVLAVAGAVVARQRVRHDGRVERPEVGEGVDVIDGRGDVEARHSWRCGRCHERDRAATPPDGAAS
jgi:hypothetical protein